MMRIILAILFTICSFIAKGEIWPMSSLVDLCLYSNLIVEAKYHSSVGDKYIFTYTEVEKSSNKIDTFELSGISKIFDFDEYRDENLDEISKMYQIERPNFKNADRIILFLYQTKSGELCHIFSGYRIVKDDKVYIPLKSSDTYTFSNWERDLNAKEFSKNLTQAIKKTSRFKSNIGSKSIKKQRNYYRKWVKKYSDELLNESSWSSSANVGWGMIGWYFQRYLKDKGMEPSEVPFEEFKDYLIQNSLIKKE